MFKVEEGEAFNVHKVGKYNGKFDRNIPFWSQNFMLFGWFVFSHRKKHHIFVFTYYKDYNYLSKYCTVSDSWVPGTREHDSFDRNSFKGANSALIFLQT